MILQTSRWMYDQRAGENITVDTLSLCTSQDYNYRIYGLPSMIR